MSSDHSKRYTTQSVMEALNVITRGRMVMDWDEISEGRNEHVVTKTSNIPGKSVIEIPGIIFGSKEKPVTKVGVAMTMTESVIELASAKNIELLVAHHPVADAANSGGVPFMNYLPLYNISVIEIHEAFHGLHPGMALIHGHRKRKTYTSFAGIPGNVLHVGEALDEVKTAGDIIKRLESYMGYALESRLLDLEREVRSTREIEETTLANPAMLLNGEPDAPVNHVLHFFPHTGFNKEHLRMALEQYPETDTLIASISRVKEDHELVAEAKKLGLNFIVGNPHSVEIFENGLPLAYALERMLPGLEIYLMRERVTATPLQCAALPNILQYGKAMADTYLVPEEYTDARKEMKKGKAAVVKTTQ